MTTPGHVALREAAPQLGVSIVTLRRWAYAGMVTYWLIGRGRRMEFDPQDIEALGRSFRHDRQAPPVYWETVP